MGKVLILIYFSVMFEIRSNSVGYILFDVT